MIRVLLEEVLKARKEVNSKSNRPDFTEYLSSIPKGPDVFDRIRDSTPAGDRSQKAKAQKTDQGWSTNMTLYRFDIPG